MSQESQTTEEKNNYRMTISQNTKIQGTGIQKYKFKNLQKYRNTYYKNTKIQNTEINNYNLQKYIDINY